MKAGSRSSDPARDRAEPRSEKPERADSQQAHELNPLWMRLASQALTVRSKLAVGAQEDPEERQADRAADRVLRMTAAGVDDRDELDPSRTPSPVVRRVCADCDEERVQRQPLENEYDEDLDGTVYARSEAGSSPARIEGSTAARIRSLRGGGSPLPSASLAFFQPRFGADLAGVRVHTGAGAAQTARDIRARAYTFGSDIVFGSGEYHPESEGGRRLLAHELAHVVQRSGGDPEPPIRRQAETSEAGASSTLLVDDAGDAGPGQLHLGEFLAEVRTQVCRAAEEILAPAGQTAADCPYLARIFPLLERQTAAFAESTLRSFAPELGAPASARAYIPAILERVRASTADWVETGEISGLPENLPSSVRALVRFATTDERAESAATVQFKARPGATPVAESPLAIRSELGPGQPLDAPVRSRMESAIGANYADVRVHTDIHAQRVTSDLGATALTVGEHVAFAGGAYQPGTLIGDAIIAHELAHVAQQNDSNADTAPQEDDISRSLLEADAERSALRAVASMWSGVEGATAASGNALPRRKSGLKLQRCVLPSSDPRDRRTIDEVRADLEAAGALGPKTDLRALPQDYVGPAVSLESPLGPRDQAALAADPRPMTVAELALELRSIEAQLEQLEPLMQTHKEGTRALSEARARVTAARAVIGSTDATTQTRRILRTRVVLEQSRRALSSLLVTAEMFGQPGIPHAARYATLFARVNGLFDVAVSHSLQDDVLEHFEKADQAAARLPHDLISADLGAFENLSAGAQMLQPAIRDINGWAGRLRPRLAEVSVKARALAAARESNAANLSELEAQFRDHSEALHLSLEALSYWEQLARGYAFMAGHPPYDMRAIDAVGRLMARVRQMRDADERGDVALLEVLVRQYREDADVQRFLRNIHVFVAFSRTAVSLGIVLAAAMASAGVGAGAAAAIGPTATTGGAIASFAGVTALEALTFTAVSRGLQSALPGQQLHGSFWNDLAWNLGLFSLLKVANLGAVRATASVGIPRFTRLVQHSTAYPLLVGYGALRFRIELGQWPSADEFNQMMAETLIMVAGFAVGTSAFGGSGTKPPKELVLFRSRYGLQFETLNAGRQSLSEQVMQAARGPAPEATRAEVGRRARILERELEALIQKVKADPDVSVPKLRDALRGFTHDSAGFAMQIRLMDAGLTEASIAAIEGRIASLPESSRHPTRTQLGDVAAHAVQVLPDRAVRQEILETVSRVAANPRIRGFEHWVRFSTAQRPGTSAVEQQRNFLDQVGELRVAEGLSGELQPGQHVEAGGDAHRQLRPGTTDLLPSFDLSVEGAGVRRNVEVYSPQGARPVVGDFGDAINHAADKIISDPGLPSSMHTAGRVEAAVRTNWPPPNNVTRAGTIETASNGDVTLVTANGRRIPRGNFLDDYVNNLNHATRSPSGSNRVDVLTVYDRAGNAIYRYTRDPSTNVWSGTPL